MIGQITSPYRISANEGVVYNAEDIKLKLGIKWKNASTAEQE